MNFALQFRRSQNTGDDVHQWGFGNDLTVVTPEKRGFSGFLYGGRVSPNPKKRVFSGQNYVGFLGDPLARLT